MKLSPTQVQIRAMNAEQFLSLAETLRSYAQHSGRDLNAANLFVHEMLLRAIRIDPVDGPAPQPQQQAPQAAALTSAA